ncbi:MULTISPECIES: protein NO VEIN domain-containing protein [Providencia]|uniref:protein NO VEIN domain-containing protein n=1 Tax=Providencia TaxID=586 RepID=UPI002349C0BD|nr:DUF3883 domain-containing protein [Providencia sp. PROV129]
MAILFCNIGWMENYRGETTDKIINGGSYVSEMKTGHENRNFLEFGGKYYGYVRNRGSSFDLERISGNDNIKEPYIDGVDVIWCATSPSDGNVVIGWYRNARVFRNIQKLDENTAKPRAHYDEEESYWFEADAKDSLLLPVEERTLRVPRNGKGLMGTSPFWYGDSREGADFVERVKRIINLRTSLINEQQDSMTQEDIISAIYNSNPELRRKTEKSAVARTTEYYEKQGYSIKSVERDNVGWDLEAYKSDELLRIEVKGLFGLGKQIQLTPNEYRHFLKNESDYRLCIVNNALSDEDFNLYVCFYSSRNQCWSIENCSGGKVNWNEYVSAIVQITA